MLTNFLRPAKYFEEYSEISPQNVDTDPRSVRQIKQMKSFSFSLLDLKYCHNLVV
jgi:hypothetical protein